MYGNVAMGKLQNKAERWEVKEEINVFDIILRKIMDVKLCGWL